MLRRIFNRPSAASMVSRNRAFVAGQGRLSWPPRLEDPFLGLTTVPEISVANLSSEVLGGSILHHGCLLVRGLIGPRAVARLADALERAFIAAAAFRSGSPPTAYQPWFDPYPLSPKDQLSAGARTFVFDGAGVWTADAPPAFEILVTQLKQAGVVKAVEGFLGETVSMSVGKSTLRRVPPSSGSGWHQDGAFLGSEIRTVNCWLALSECGVDSPGLDIFPCRAPGLYETGTKGADFSWSVGDGVVKELEESTSIAVAAPTFHAGDCLLFDQVFLHRTGVRPGMTKDRLAIETWLFAGSTFPMDQVPLAL
jgi:hypothetical protein